MNKKLIGLILGLMCLILTCGICIQVKTVNSANSPLSTSSTENDLRDQVLKAKEKYDNKYNDLEKITNELEQERKNITENNSELTSLEEQINQGNKILGLTEVTGTGVIVTLKDNDTLSSNSNIDLSNSIVHDVDIIAVINELKNAGAEAISINEHRVVPTTSISCDGNVIKINGEKVGAPFEIKAIGLPEQLAALQRPGGYLDLLDGWGVITEFKKVNTVTIPKYTGVIDFKYAQNVK